MDISIRQMQSRSEKERPVLITGGAGFVGTNLADRLLESGTNVLIYDDLSCPGVEENLRWLLDKHSARVHVRIADVRDGYALRAAVREASEVFHLAAQVSVTDSLENPVSDFGANAFGTLNLLEALHWLDDPPPLVYASTSRVYGELEDIALEKDGTRYEPVDFYTHTYGISEKHTLDFRSPYGCSKGTADQYVLDYAHSFGIPAVVLRMSCVYGPHQRGADDEGRVAHLVAGALKGHPIALHGERFQVCDVLFVEDLVNGLLLARENMGACAGEAYNIGGGPGNTVSVSELVELIGGVHGQEPDVHYEPMRPGDQRYYVSDTRKFEQATGWFPQVDVLEGVRRLYQWFREAYGLRSQFVIYPHHVLRS